MLLNSVLLVLRETLEAALIVSILLALSSLKQIRPAWLSWGLAAGAVFAASYAANMEQISQWFDYVGQEVTNALLQMVITAAIVVFTWAFVRGRVAAQLPGGRTSKYLDATCFLCATSIVALSITREGFEIIVFIGGFLHQSGNVQAVLIGSLIGVGIGISIGILIYYGIMALSKKARMRVLLLSLALFGGNMLSQSMLELTQADWIAATAPLWNTSAWLAENSIAGHLLYALVGYEASPSLAQVAGYLAGLTAVLAAAALGKKITVGLCDADRSHA